MRRFLKSLLILTLTLTTLTSSTEACCFCPLLNPFQWGCGYHHHDPYATRRVIDDWLGYGYLRGNENGSLGHYPYRPGSCFCPLLLPFHIFSNCLFPSPCGPGPCGPAWGSPYANGYCGVQPLVPPMSAPMPAPMMPYTPTPFGNECCPSPCVPQPMQCAPTPVQVPVTTWRPVTVDRGSYQMVWVPRPVTELVPQTSWQTQYQMPYQPQMPATDCGPSCSGINESMMPMPSGPVPMNAPLQIPMQTGCGGSAPCQSQGTAWNGGTSGWNSANSWQPGMNTAWTPIPRPQMAALPNAWQPFPNSMPQQMAMQQQMAWRPGYPVANNPYYGAQAQPYYGNNYANRMPYPAYAQAYPRPQYSAYQSYPSYAAGHAYAPSPAYPSAMMPPMQAAYPQAEMGDLMGDHEMATIPGTAPMTGMAPANGTTPVIQNSFRGGIPVYQTSYAAPMRPQSVNKYKNVIR